MHRAMVILVISVFKSFSEAEAMFALKTAVRAPYMESPTKLPQVLLFGYRLI